MAGNGQKQWDGKNGQNSKMASNRQKTVEWLEMVKNSRMATNGQKQWNGQIWTKKQNSQEWTKTSEWPNMDKKVERPEMDKTLELVIVSTVTCFNMSGVRVRGIEFILSVLLT